jgi:hypothetical protein
VTPDGKYLFFSGRNGVDYWVNASDGQRQRVKTHRVQQGKRVLNELEDGDGLAAEA